MNAHEVAEELGVAERTVRRWIAAGRLGGEKRGGSFDIDIADAREVLNGSRPGRAVLRSSELAEMRGRLLEARATILRLENELANARVKTLSLERILWPGATLDASAALDNWKRAERAQDALDKEEA